MKCKNFFRFEFFTVVYLFLDEKITMEKLKFLKIRVSHVDLHDARFSKSTIKVDWLGLWVYTLLKCKKMCYLNFLA